jgi:type VI secretion system protein ImpA
MASLPEGFDLEVLLAPIAGDMAVGPDLRADYAPQAAYFRLRDARAEARTQERQADAAGQDGGAAFSDAIVAAGQNWRIVMQLAPLTIAETSKDLEIAAWYTEALVRAEGLIGLAAGARLMEGLAERFWDGLYPLPDEDGIETRVAAVTGLNGQGGDGTLIQSLNKIVLFERPNGAPYAPWNYERTKLLAGVTDKARREAAIEAGSLPVEDMKKEARANGGARFTRLVAEASLALEAWQAMGRAIDAHAGADGPPTSRVAEVLGAILDFAREFAPAAAEEPVADETAAETAGGELAAGTAPGAAAAATQLVTRESALRTLSEVANYFRRTEPHSPLAYTLDEAVRRGRMSWPELLAEILPDAASREAVLNSLGIRPVPPE